MGRSPTRSEIDKELSNQTKRGYKEKKKVATLSETLSAEGVCDQVCA